MITQQKRIMRIMMLIIMSLTPFSSVLAEQFIENVTVKQGSRTRLTIPNAYQNILANFGSGYPYSWWSDNTYVCTATTFRSKNFCEIYANSVGTTEIHYKGEYYSGGVHSELTCYWFINVEPSEEGGSSGGGDNATTTDEDYTLPEESWSDVGNYNISWYNKSQTEFNISTNKELAGMAYLINNGYTDFSGKTIKITGEIDLSGKRWLSAGNSESHCFKGTFDGQNYTIKGLCIGRQNDNQQYFGFFGYLSASLIHNVILQGEVIIINPVCSANSTARHYIGGLVGYSSSSTIENCRCDIPIKYSRNIQTTGKVDNIYIGGLLGYGSGTHTIKYCSHEGDISCIQTPIIAGDYAAGKPFIGGLVGDCSGVIEYCEHVSSIIYCEIPRHSKIGCYNINVSGITAGSLVTIKHCRSICNFDILHRGCNYGAKKQFYIGGISRSYLNPVIDCYASVSKVSVVYEQVYANSGITEVHYAGIRGNEDNAANFSNSDVDIQTNHTLIRENDGSTAYSSTQMRSSAFLEELNLYSILEEGGAVWTQDEGGYPYIAKLHEKPDIISVTNINLDNSSLKLSIGKTQQLAATVYPDNATNKVVSWSSDNTNVATVDNTGLVTAISEGTATITCSSNDGSGVTATCTVTVIDPNSIYITSANFPDDNFRNWLLESYYGKDGKFTEDEIRNITSLSVNEKNISTLKGIEFFTSLDYLNCSYNQLTSFDLSKNTALTTLYCYSNQLTSLDVTKNTALKSLHCDRNQLTSLDVTKNTALTTLNCSYNQLTSLDVSKNTALKNLFFHVNHLTSLDVSNNTALIGLFGSTNQLTSLDVSKNTALTGLQCNRNQINGKAMDELISSLPYNSSDKTYEFDVISPSYDDEGNVCTKSQVAAAKAKGWTPRYDDGSSWQEYEGSQDLSTCAEVIAGVDGEKYCVSGVVRKITNTTYGNWYLVDETGEIYIYGTLDKEGKTKNFSSLGIKEGYIVTVEGPRKTYKGTIELVDVTVVDIQEHGYYYVGTQNGFDLLDRSYPFSILSDGKTWGLTMQCTEDDWFLIVPPQTTTWDEVVYCVSQDDYGVNSGTMVKDSTPPFYVQYENGMSSFTIYIVPSTMKYEIETQSVSGINMVITDKDTDTQIYSLSGQKLKAPQKGINIVGGKKVVVK